MCECRICAMPSSSRHMYITAQCVLAAVVVYHLLLENCFGLKKGDKRRYTLSLRVWVVSTRTTYHKSSDHTNIEHIQLHAYKRVCALKTNAGRFIFICSAHGQMFVWNVWRVRYEFVWTLKLEFDGFNCHWMKIRLNTIEFGRIVNHWNLHKWDWINRFSIEKFDFYSQGSLPDDNNNTETVSLHEIRMTKNYEKNLNFATWEINRSFFSISSV